MKVKSNIPLLVAALFSVSCFTLFSQPLLERNEETATRYLRAYAEADLNTLDSVLHRDYRHYLFDIPKEDFDGLINLVRKKGNVGNYQVLENIAFEDKVIVGWICHYPPDTYNGLSLFSLKDGQIIEEREYFKKIE